MGFLEDLKKSVSTATIEIIDAKKEVAINEIKNAASINSGTPDKARFESESESSDEPSMMPYLLGGLAVLALAFFVIPQNKGG